ncbi:homocysteine S-methyltransferase family protein [bacterium]|nr:homocysteine S-methyltransferase family protein [bacterium]
MQKLAKPILMDGAIGTELIRRGIKLEGASCKINLTHPDLVAQIHRDYLKAGSQMLLTNTFGLTVDDDLEPLITKAYQLLPKASIGASIAPLFTGTEDQRKKSYQQQYTCHIKRAPDFIILETFITAAEARLALESYPHTNIPLMILFSKTQKGWLISSDEIKKLIQDFKLTHVGFNCSDGPASVKDMFSSFKNTEVELIVKPNTGLPAMSDDQFVAEMNYYIENGAAYIGGCCGTSPTTIHSLKATVTQPTSRGA